MDCSKYSPLITAYVDCEISNADRMELKKHLSHCEKCSNEVSDFERLKEVTDDMKFVSPDDKVWSQYWSDVYNRLERRVAWILFSIGAVVLISYGVYKFVEEVLISADVDWPIKVGIVCLIAGAITLLVSVCRERLFAARKVDKYKEVQK